MKQQDLRVIKSTALERNSEPNIEQQEDEQLQLVNTEERKGQHQTRVVTQIKVTDTITPENEKKRNVNSKGDSITRSA